MIDCIYVVASARDARYTRICVASIRYFYPHVSIQLLPGGRLQRGLARELHRYWNVKGTDLFERADYGWGFVKLELLFGRSGEKFLVLDSDTVFTGRVLDLCMNVDAPFVVDDEAQSPAATKRLYYDWERVRNIDPHARPPQFVFNTGQWFGTAGVLTRNDFTPWVEWTRPRRLRYPEFFMPGDQGVLNYVLNQKAAISGLTVARKRIMRWPGHSMEGLDAKAISQYNAPASIVHWAGIKKSRQRDMSGGDLLAYFEEFYYRRLPGGKVRRLLAACRDRFSTSLIDFQARVVQACKNVRATREATVPGRSTDEN